MEMMECDLPGIPKISSGKVREIFDLGDALLLVATDRISAFDCILPNPIPRKGEVLTRISAFWFGMMDFLPNHLISLDELPSALAPHAEKLAGRSMVVKKAQPLPVECVVRGYLAGGGWKEYQNTGAVSGIKLPSGLRQAEKLPEPIFTPSTKAASGHDEPISWEQCCAMIGTSTAGKVREYSLELYRRGRDHAAERGIIIADTKFEFGIADGEVILIDECLTPDSSRFWPADSYEVGCSPPSFDKQFVRDYLETLNWDKTPPAPELPQYIIQKTSRKYQEAYRRLTGRELD